MQRRFIRAQVLNSKSCTPPEASKMITYMLRHNETLSQTDAITLERAVTALQQVGTAQYALPEGVNSVGDEPQEKTKKKHRKEGEKKRRHAEGDDGKSAKKEKKEKKKRKHD
ncbi:hypothetical protein QBZ16_000247 [Prototheca wickerhamii]|uniref:Uncharacterized protein n=1 Tax=Prototheca wickerhamii TaxID=3111 RepID=A0AAD9IN55_PROWI|nr:hypothetical protein QBZ16_000247 [Prototheca wickerhamii]